MLREPEAQTASDTPAGKAKSNGGLTLEDLESIALQNNPTLAPRAAADIRGAEAEVNLAYVDALTELSKVSIEIDGLQLTGGLNPAAIGMAIQSQPGGSGRS